MELVIHKHFTIQPKKSFFSHFYSVPIWEIELQGYDINNLEFESLVKDQNNYNTIKFSEEIFRYYYEGDKDDAVHMIKGQTFKEQIIDVVSTTKEFKEKYVKNISEIRNNFIQFANIILDYPGFYMSPHIDNVNVVVQCIVNLIQDNETSTEFYTSDSEEPVYQAPKKKNHGVMFLNTHGSIHGIRNIKDYRWIWYSSILA